MKKLILTLILLINFSVCNAEIISHEEHNNYSFITEKYTVLKNDTLFSITQKFMNKNTYGKREFNEFREGIIENNPQLDGRDVLTDEVLIITYWVKNE